MKKRITIKKKIKKNYRRSKKNQIGGVNDRNCYTKKTDIDNDKENWLCKQSLNDDDYELSNNPIPPNSYPSGPYEKDNCNCWCGKTYSNKMGANNFTGELLNFVPPDLNSEVNKCLNPYDYTDACHLEKLYLSSKKKRNIQKEYEPELLTIIKLTKQIHEENSRWKDSNKFYWFAVIPAAIRQLQDVKWNGLTPDDYDKEKTLKLLLDPHPFPHIIMEPIISQLVPLLRQRVKLWGNFLHSCTDEQLHSIIIIVMSEPERFTDLVSDFSQYIQTQTEVEVINY